LNYIYIHFLGNKADFDHWSSLGNYGWSYEDVLPFFKKTEDMREPNAARDSRHHGTGGPVTVEHGGFHSPSTKVFLDACQHLGLGLNTDFNGDNQLGCGLFHQTTRQGSRVSTAKAFLKGASKRPNLDILLYSVVEKVHVLDKHAKGVRVKRNGESFDIWTEKEVILSAGVIASPQILLLSGIGPAFHMKEMGIPLKADLPVGYNLQSHAGPGEPAFLVNDSWFTFNFAGYGMNSQSWTNYFATGTGPMSTPSGFEAMAFYNTGVSNDSWPDIQLIYQGIHLGTDGTMFYSKALNLNPEEVSFLDKLIIQIQIANYIRDTFQGN
jgi:choline dehydrogenase